MIVYREFDEALQAARDTGDMQYCITNNSRFVVFPTGHFHGIPDAEFYKKAKNQRLRISRRSRRNDTKPLF